MISISCAICENKQKIIELYPETINFEKVNAETFSARRTPDRMHFRLVKCTNCDLIFSNPILGRHKIDNLYKKSSFSYIDESKYLKKTYLSYLEKALVGLDKSKLKLLDIGCGNGFFLEEVKNFGVKSVYGVEPSKAAVEKASKNLKKNIKNDILKPNLFKNNFFDVICCFHTLDHITNPNSFLKICFKLLKKDGIILFVVHNTDGLSVKVFGEKSAIFDIEHIYLFNPKSLSTIFAKNGFKIIDIFDIKNRYPISYWTRMVPIPTPLKYLFLKILEVTNIGKVPLAIKPGNIGIIARK